MVQDFVEASGCVAVYGRWAWRCKEPISANAKGNRRPPSNAYCRSIANPCPKSGPGPGSSHEARMHWLGYPSDQLVARLTGHTTAYDARRWPQPVANPWTHFESTVQALTKCRPFHHRRTVPAPQRRDRPPRSWMRPSVSSHGPSAGDGGLSASPLLAGHGVKPRHRVPARCPVDRRQVPCPFRRRAPRGRLVDGHSDRSSWL